MSVAVLLPMHLPSVANLREHWRVRAKRSKSQRGAARLALLPYARQLRTIRDGGGVICVELTRVSPRKLDSDNLQSALKAVRDGVADAFELDDGSARYCWGYAQLKGSPSVGITISVEPTAQE